MGFPYVPGRHGYLHSVLREREFHRNDKPLFFKGKGHAHPVGYGLAGKPLLFHGGGFGIERFDVAELIDITYLQQGFHGHFCDALSQPVILISVGDAVPAHPLRILYRQKPLGRIHRQCQMSGFSHTLPFVGRRQGSSLRKGDGLCGGSLSAAAGGHPAQQQE